MQTSNNITRASNEVQAARPIMLEDILRKEGPNL